LEDEEKQTVGAKVNKHCALFLGLVAFGRVEYAYYKLVQSLPKFI